MTGTQHSAGRLVLVAVALLLGSVVAPVVGAQTAGERVHGGIDRQPAMVAASANATDGQSLEFGDPADVNTDVTLTTDGTGVVIENPLLVDGTKYAVRIRTTSPDATYTDRLAAEDGRLVVRSRGLAGAETVTVWVSRHGTPVLEGVEDGELGGSTPQTTAEITHDGAVIELNESTGVTGDATLWIRNDTQQVQTTVRVDRTRVNLTGTDLRLDADGSYRLILRTNEGVVRARLPGDGQEGPLYRSVTDRETLLTVPVLGGVSVQQLAGGVLVLAGFAIYRRRSGRKHESDESDDDEDGTDEAERDEAAADESGTTKELTLRIRDGNGDPLANASIRCDPDPVRTSELGGGTTDYEFASHASTVTVTVRRSGYQPVEKDVELEDAGGFDSQTTETITLEPQRGGLGVKVTVDGAPVGDVPVTVVPGDDVDEQGGERWTGRTTDDGIATFDDLLVGKYEIRAEMTTNSDQFSVDPIQTSVKAKKRNKTAMRAEFEYELSETQRQRLETLDREIAELTAPSGRDVAIPYYYGSVVEELTAVAEAVPEQGHRFATTETPPDRIADALLDAAETGLERVQVVMKSKRNIDLLTACVDMADTRTAWSGSFDDEAVFEYLAENTAERRRRQKERLETVDSRIDSERSQLATTAPAREMWDAVRELIQEQPGDPTAAAATALVVEGLLEATEELFEHPELRERLERTVF